jgi:DNA-binding NarL/FixJ family response regulator
MTIRILLADDHAILRAGLRALLEFQPGFMVVGEAENGRQALRLTRERTPDLVLMDVSMPDLNGIDAARQLRSDHPEVKVLALSMYSNRQFIEGMLAAGVSGYLLKDCVMDELIDAIRTVARGQTYLSPKIAGTVVRGYLDRLSNGEPSPGGLLTAREREVLQLVAEGFATREIAERLHVSPKTVETHRRNLMDKLNLHSVAELTKFAIREGITGL